MKKAAFLIVLGIFVGLLADCFVAYPTFGPPALRAEVRVGPPGPGYVWIGGYWAWGGGNYYWRSGHWARAQHGRSWTDGRWEQRGRRWVWRKGYWR